MRKRCFRAAFWLLAAAAVISFVAGFRRYQADTVRYGGIDLRNRVVGARLLKAGLEPYFFKWQKGLPDTLLDPIDRPARRANRITAPPSVLAFTSFFARLPYGHIRLLWFYIEYLCFAGIVFIFFLSAGSLKKRLLLLIVGLLFFAGSLSWHMEVERGQAYIVYSLLLSLAFNFTRTRRPVTHWLSGLLLALTAYIRPLAAVFLVPLALGKRWSLLKAALLGIFFFAVCTIAAGQLTLWKSYYGAMKEWSHYQLKNEITLPTVQSPAQIEGMTNLGRKATFRNEHLSVQRIAKNILKLDLHGNTLFLFFVMLAGVLLFFLRKVVAAQRPDTLFLIGFLLMMLGEYCTPAPRYPYNYIQWIVPVFIIILNYDILASRAFPLFLMGLALHLEPVASFLNLSLIIGELCLFSGTLIVLRGVGYDLE